MLNNDREVKEAEPFLGLEFHFQDNDGVAVIPSRSRKALISPSRLFQEVCRVAPA